MIGHKITTERRSDDWIAFFTEQPEVWDVGATQAEALGKLYISYPDLASSITPKKQGDDWIAFITERPEMWESGCTQAEAIRKLYISYPDLLGIIRN